MTVEDTTNKTRQVGDNITVAFSFLFKVFAGREATDLLVYKIDKSTTPETQGSALTYTTDYQVVLSTTGEGGTVTYTVAPTSTEDAFIIREVDYKQETELKPNNKFNEVAIENSFDKDAMVNTQLLEQTDRSLKVSEIYTGSTDFTLPPPEASKVIGYDSTGLVMANYSGSDLDTILTTSYGQQLVQSANAEAARDVLELGTSDDVEFNDITANDITANDITANSITVNTPTFKATLSGDQTPIVNTLTKVQFDTEAFDNGGYYDKDTNYRYKPLVAGKYVVNSNLNTQSDAAYDFELYIFKNGVDLLKVENSSSAAGQLAQNINSIVEMNGTTDYLEVFAKITAGTTILFDDVYSEFSAFKFIE